MLIGIIGAMDEEVAFLLEQMEDKEETKVANCVFVTGSLQNKRVVLLKSGIGKVNAAMSTTLLLETYLPDYVINTGSAGGLDLDLNIGDLVISSEVVHHDVDVTAFNYQYGQVPGLPVTFKAAKRLVEKAGHIINELGVGQKVGKIASGDAFIADPKQVNLIQSKIPDVIAVEMEAAAIAQVCYQYEIPFIIIRALSDIAGKESSTSFEQFLKQASKNTTDFIVKMVKEA